MNFEHIDNFLEWILDKKQIVYTYESDSLDFISKPIHTINFQSLGNPEVCVLRCPIRKKDNANFLRIIRKVLFEITERTIVTYNLKDFLNFIPGKISQNKAKIYDIQLLESIIRSNSNNVPECHSLIQRLRQITSQLNKIQMKLYDEILLPSSFLYSNIEKSGMPSKFGINLYSYYNLSGTVSGRLTNCSFDNKKFINPLNLAKNKRNIIQAPLGYKLINADYNAMEMRMLAYVSQDQALLKIFEDESQDVYKTIGKNIFKIDEINDKMRQIIKDVCFIVIFGGTEYGFSKKQGCSLDEASAMIRKFFGMFPSIEEWSLQTQISICEKGYVESIFGRKRVVNIEEDKESALRQGQNFLIQSPANDITMSTMSELNDKILEDSKILIHLHDCITILTPDSKIEGNKKIIMDTMKSPKKIRGFGINNIKLFPTIKILQNWW